MNNRLVRQEEMVTFYCVKCNHPYQCKAGERNILVPFFCEKCKANKFLKTLSSEEKDNFSKFITN